MNKIVRLLHLIQDIRLNPGQSLESLLKAHQISRAQFYRDKKALAALGFQFKYRSGAGFVVVEDRLSPIAGLSLSDKVILLCAVESLSATGDGMLAAWALEVGRKLAGALEKPFCGQMQTCFDSEVIQKGHGLAPGIFQELINAVSQRKRIRILYRRSMSWTENWRTLDPGRIYMRERNLYLYARTVDENPAQWKVFRLNRIQAVEPTGINFNIRADEDDGFAKKIKNAFSAFLGDNPRKITLRFTGFVIPFIRENMWHHSQVLEDQPDGSLHLTVCVAEPKEVEWWAAQFGPNAQVLEIEPDDMCVLGGKKK